MKSINFLALIFLIVATSCHKDDLELIDEMVDVGGYKLYTISEGEGDKTVVFESGLGNDYSVWWAKETFQNTSSFAQSIAYSRAGYAPSEKGVEPRSLEQFQTELGTLIDRKAKSDKIVLVGHSLGGMIIRAFAINNPEKIAGLVFVDPTHEDYREFTQEDEDQMVNDLIEAGGEGIITAKEAEQFLENMEYIKTLGMLPDVPTIVLTSMKIVPGTNAEERQNWYDAHKKLGEGLSDFKHIATEKSGHHIMIDEPDLVLSAIHEIVEK